MSSYIQRGQNGTRNHLMVDRIPVDTREPDWLDRLNVALCWLLMASPVALVLAMGAAAM